MKLKGQIKLWPLVRLTNAADDGHVLEFTLDCRPYDPERVYRYFWSWIAKRYPDFVPSDVQHRFTPTTFYVRIIASI